MASKAKRRKKRQRMRRLIPVLIVILLILLIAGILVGSHLYKKYSPSKDIVDYNEFYSIAASDEVVILMDDVQLEEKGKMIDGEVYVDTEFLYDNLNSRFYWDSHENTLLYALPTELVTTEAGSRDYMVGKTKKSASYAPVRLDGSTAYVALDYIKDYTAITFEVSKEPVNLVQIRTQFGEVEYVEVKKDTQVRDKAGIKREILAEVVKGEKLYVMEEYEEIEEWTRVRTEAGQIGYVQDKRIGERKQETLTCDYVEPVYESISKDYTINMAWHQVTAQAANENIYKVLADTKGLNTISPTWFYLKDNEGGIESLASQEYVDYCHQNGIEVWALVEDITYADTITNYEIFSRTSSRQRLVSNLIAQAIQYDLDGINLDMEFINAETGRAYVQFIRELSIMCRLNGIVLSVDNYAPAEYNMHYDRAEQGVFADYVIIMGYDEHYKKSPVAGSVASIGFVRDGIENTLREVPAEKVINAIPFYTRVWKEVESNAEGSVNGILNSCEAEVGMNSAEKYAKTNGVEPNWSEVHGQYYVEYEKDGATYKIWLEEERSIEEKLKLMKEHNLAGVAAWKLGFQRSSIWDVILKYTN